MKVLMKPRSCNPSCNPSCTPKLYAQAVRQAVRPAGRSPFSGTVSGWQATSFFHQSPQLPQQASQAFLEPGRATDGVKAAPHLRRRCQEAYSTLFDANKGPRGGPRTAKPDSRPIANATRHSTLDDR